MSQTPDNKQVGAPATGHPAPVGEKPSRVHQVLAQLGLSLSLQEGANRYTLYDEIGRGGVARVHSAKDTALHREVAAKILRKRYLSDDGAIAHFLNEAKIMVKLNHPGIVPVYDIGLIGNELFFAMERVQGRTLRQLLDERQSPRDVQRALDDLIRIFEQVCLIVGYAHSRGVVHRDLKPENIMVGDFDTIFVMDWGIARDLSDQAQTRAIRELVGEQRDLTALLDARKVKGTPKYMSPEQAVGMDEVTYATDVFALGLILYEILAGRHPFETDNARDLLHAIKQEPAPPLTAFYVSNDLRSICAKALEKLPANRYPHAGDVAEDIRRTLSHHQVSVRHDNLAVRAWKFTRRHRVLSFATVVVAVVAGILLVGRLADRRDYALLLEMADRRLAAAGHCDELIRKWERVDEEPLRSRQLARYKAIQSMHLAGARGLLSVALRKHGRDLPARAVRALKDTWFAELQYALQLQDDDSARATFNELQDYLEPDNAVMGWTADEQQRIKRYRDFLFRGAAAAR